nr:C1 family peptidase [Synergistales bacterium]
VNPLFLRYLDEVQDISTIEVSGYGYPAVSGEDGTKSGRTGAIPSMLFLPKPVSEQEGGLLLAGAVLPSAYDLRDEGLVTPVRDQHSYGTCWAFGAMGSIESYLKRSDIARDLSEYHLAWWAYNGSPSFTAWDPSFGDHPTLDQGGNAVMALAMLSRWSGAVNENDCPYDQEGEQPDTQENSKVVEHLQNAYYMDPSGTSVIKKAIMEYGAVNMMIIWNDACYNRENASYFMTSPPAGLSGLHTLVIVGWDNNYSRYRFSPSAPVDGAWIVKNSWGRDWGEDGYFWLSYANNMTEQDEPFIEPWVFLSEPSRNYSKNYHYDPLGWTGNIGYYDGSDYF